MDNQVDNTSAVNEAVTAETTTPTVDENALFVTEKVAFPFRKDAEGKKRETIELHIESPTVKQIVTIFESGNQKGINKILGLMRDAVVETCRNILTDNPALTAATFPADKLGWQAYEDLQESERKINGISQALWQAFKDDFIAVMPGISGIPVERIKNAAKKLIDQRLANDKTDKAMLQVLFTRLSMYAEKAPNAANYVDCIEALSGKIKTYLETDTSVYTDLV